MGVKWFCDRCGDGVEGEDDLSPATVTGNAKLGRLIRPHKSVDLCDDCVRRLLLWLAPMDHEDD